MVAMVLSVMLAASAAAPAETPTTLRGVLLEQLKTTHNVKDWFVPANGAVEGLTAEQAKWTDGKGNHSVGQLAAHLIFWDREQLAKFKGEPPPAFSGDNNETFNNFDAAKWAQTQKDLDAVLTDWEKAVETCDDAKLAKWASTIAHISAHNAYHIGQMIYVRKQAGNWDPEKGVK